MLRFNLRYVTYTYENIRQLARAARIMELLILKIRLNQKISHKYVSRKKYS